MNTASPTNNIPAAIACADCFNDAFIISDSGPNLFIIKANAITGGKNTATTGAINFNPSIPLRICGSNVLNVAPTSANAPIGAIIKAIASVIKSIPAAKTVAYLANVLA